MPAPGSSTQSVTTKTGQLAVAATGTLEVSGVRLLAREGLVIKNETVIAIRAHQDSEIVLVVSAG